MRSRTAGPVIAGALLLAVLAAPGRGQQKAGEPKPGTAPFSYSSGGRRDPFKDLMGGQDIKEKRIIAGFADLLLDEIRIMGIVRSKSGRVAIVSLPEGFPVTVHEGDRFADGFVLSIEDGQVVLRKTRDRGVPLSKPRDFVKEIMPEER
jgi:Tfp pilus assembly protein PilP